MFAIPRILSPNTTKIRDKAPLYIKGVESNSKHLLYWLAMTTAIPAPRAWKDFSHAAFNVHLLFISSSAPEIIFGGAETLCPV